MNRKLNVVIVLGAAYPRVSAIGSIAWEIISLLGRHDISFRLICVQQCKDKVEGEKINGVAVYTLTQWRLLGHQCMEKSMREYSGFRHILFRYASYFFRGLGWLQSRLLTIDNYWWYKKKAYRKLCELHKNSPIDILLTMSNPIESHMAGQLFKQDHPTVRWITYFGDLFPRKENRTNFRISLEQMRAIEASIVQNADHILVTDELLFHFANKYKIGTKLASLPYILKTDILQRPTVPVRKKGRVFICMGSVNKKSRNPEFMLQVLSKILASDDRLHLFVQGDCDVLINRYVAASEGTIVSHGIVPQQELIDAMHSADYLVSIGNAIKISTPSKVFELISYRKPVIDFYYQGVQEEAWTGYPEYCAIQIGGELSKSMEKIDAFINRTTGNVDLNVLKTVYHRHLPENAAQIVEYAFGFRGTHNAIIFTKRNIRYK